MAELPVRPGRLGVVTVEEALRAGWTRSSLAHALRTGGLVRPHRGTVAPPWPADDPRGADVQRARVAVAGSLLAPGTVVSHLAAATLLGLPVWAPHPRPCTTNPGVVTRAGALHVHRATVAGQVTRTGDVRVTTPARTVVDVGREFGLESAVVVGDAALRQGLLNPADLVAVTRAVAGWPGGRRVTALPDLLDSASESPLESRSRCAFRKWHLPAPLTQVDLFEVGGRFLGRPDFYWTCGVVGEVDGSVKYVDRAVLRREKWRQESFERTGLSVARWGGLELESFGPTAARIRVLLARAAASPHPPGWYVVPPRT